MRIGTRSAVRGVETTGSGRFQSRIGEGGGRPGGAVRASMAACSSAVRAHINSPLTIGDDDRAVFRWTESLTSLGADLLDGAVRRIGATRHQPMASTAMRQPTLLPMAQSGRPVAGLPERFRSGAYASVRNAFVPHQCRCCASRTAWANEAYVSTIELESKRGIVAPRR